MSPFDDLEAAREDLAATLVEIFSAVLMEEVEESYDAPEPGPLTVARLSMHDHQSDEYAGVEIRASLTLARSLAARMMGMPAPTEEDVVDAVAELGNIVAGSVKSLLCQQARLSLPSCAVVPDGHPAVEDPQAQVVAALVLGQVVQVTVVPGDRFDDVVWPPVISDEVLGRL